MGTQKPVELAYMLAKTALGLLVAAGSASAFAPTLSGGLSAKYTGAQLRSSASLQPGSSSVAPSMSMTDDSAAQRRDFLRIALGGSAALAFGDSANAVVSFDTERYGDKELKVALINQVKQQFRAL